jgi:hypothetical protein
MLAYRALAAGNALAGPAPGIGVEGLALIPRAPAWAGDCRGAQAARQKMATPANVRKLHVMFGFCRICQRNQL